MIVETDSRKRILCEMGTAFLQEHPIEVHITDYPDTDIEGPFVLISDRQPMLLVTSRASQVFSGVRGSFITNDEVGNHLHDALKAFLEVYGEYAEMLEHPGTLGIRKPDPGYNTVIPVYVSSAMQNWREVFLLLEPQVVQWKEVSSRQGLPFHR